jgi:hypothetical protein
MPRIIRMPTQDELPAGPARDFVELLFRLYRAAHRPTLDTISMHIRDGSYIATASKETLRKMLRGTTIPANWPTVATVVVALCDLAGWEPDGSITMAYADGSQVEASVVEHADELWHRALDEPERSIPPRATGVTHEEARSIANSIAKSVLGTHMGAPQYDPISRAPHGTHYVDDTGRP